MKNFMLVVVGCSLIEMIVGFIIPNGKLRSSVNAVISILLFYVMVNQLLSLI